MLHYELIRICGFWDKIDADGFSLPTIAFFLDFAEIEDNVRKHHIDAYRHFDEQHWADFGVNAAERAIRALREAFEKTYEIQNSSILRETRNFRNKLAHLLEKTREEKRSDVENSQFGYEKELLHEPQLILDKFHGSVNGTSYSWSSTWEIERRNVSALWRGVVISIER